MTPFGKRAYQVMLAHDPGAPAEAHYARTLRDWLVEKCRLSVAYDADEDGLDDVSAAQSAILITENSGGAAAQEQLAALQEEAARHPHHSYRVVVVELGASGKARGLKTVRAKGPVLSASDAMAVLELLFGAGDPSPSKSFYYGGGWREPDQGLGQSVLQSLRGLDWRLIGDWPTQRAFDEEIERIEQLIGSCGALVAVLPLREDRGTSRYVIREIEIATRLGLPAVVFADERVRIDPEWRFAVTSVAPELSDAKAFASRYAGVLDNLSADWRKPPSGQHVFIGHSEVGTALKPMHRMIARLTSLPVIDGRAIEGADVPGDIVQRIRDSAFSIIDITNPHPHPDAPPKVNFALNSSIEGGIAMGAGRPFYLTCQGEAVRSPPFMFQNAQVRYYASDLDLIAHVYRFCSRHRRWVIQ